MTSLHLTPTLSIVFVFVFVLTDQLVLESQLPTRLLPVVCPTRPLLQQDASEDNIFKQANIQTNVETNKQSIIYILNDVTKSYLSKTILLLDQLIDGWGEGLPLSSRKHCVWSTLVSNQLWEYQYIMLFKPNSVCYPEVLNSPLKHQSSIPPLLKMEKKSNMTSAVY